MKKILIRITLIICIFNIGHLSATVFDDYGFSPRAAAMGNAMCGLADDANATIYNPAGTAQIKKITAGASYSALYMGLLANSPIADDKMIGTGFASVVVPIDNYVKSPMPVGNVSFSVTYLSLYNYMETKLLLSYARQINDLIEEEALPPLFLGVNGNYLMKNIGKNDYAAFDPALSGASSSSFSLDVGLLVHAYKTADQLVGVGLYAADLNQPKIGSVSKETIPMKIKGGLSYTGFAGPVPFIAVADVTYSSENLIIGGGVEALLMKKVLAIRLGGSNYDITAGLGYSINKMRFDYAFVYSIGGATSNLGSNKLSINLVF